MANLIEATPCARVLPLSFGAVELEEMAVGRMTSLSLFGDVTGLVAALDKSHGLALPQPNRSTHKDGARCIWFGHNEVLLIGADPDPRLSDHAAVVDQSDAWAVVSLRGAGVLDVLARLVPVDLRDSAFEQGHTVRTQLGHMHASVTRLRGDQFMIMVFRSMAGTLVDDLKQAMAAVASRG